MVRVTGERTRARRDRDGASQSLRASARLYVQRALGLPSSERIHAVIRFDILVRSRSFSRSSPFGVLLLAALAFAPAAGCSVYENALLEGRAAGGAGGLAEEA